MTAPALDPYDPRTFQARTFYNATPRFRDGSDTPRAYLEQCLETITAREPVVQAFVVLNEASARAAAADWHQGCARNARSANADGLCRLPGPFPHRSVLS